MVAKVVLALALLLGLILLLTTVVFRYFDKRARERHEIDQMREERDAKLLLDDTDAIDRELERERKKK